MTTLVMGASGATGRQLVGQLLNLGQTVRAIIRSPEKLPESWKNQDRLTILHASILELNDQELTDIVKGCDAIASCLGHNMTWKGIYGKPRRLVTDAVRRLSKAIESNKPEKPVKFVLMNTTGNRNRDLNEPLTIGHQMVIGLLRLLLPPHVDNEKAADYLRTEIGHSHPSIDWAVVRPDTLENHDQVTDYETYPSPTRDAIFNAGKTSRINVAHFMAKLITDDAIWQKWKGQMPVIYNKASRK